MVLFLTNLTLKNHKQIKKEKPTFSCRLFRVVISLKYKRVVEDQLFSTALFLFTTTLSTTQAEIPFVGRV